MLDMRANLGRVQEAVARACARAGRSPDHVLLIAVSKTMDVERVRLGAGVRLGQDLASLVVVPFATELAIKAGAMDVVPCHVSQNAEFIVDGREGASALDDEILSIIRMEPQQHMLGARLSHGQKQWLEIGMLLMQEPRLLLLDEPVAGMTDEETERTAELFLSLEGSHSLVVVEHDMKFIHELTRDNPEKKVTVLHEGSVLCEGSVDQVQQDERVREVYLGRSRSRTVGTHA